MDFDDYETLPSASMGTHMIAGAFAGVLEHCFLYPLDSIKTRMQSLRPGEGARYKSITDALYNMVKHEGILRPMRGMSVVVSGAGPAHALYFSSYEHMKRILMNSSRQGHHHIAHGAAGCMATLLHDAIMTPSDAVKQRLQMYKSPYKGSMDCIRTMYRKEGLRAFYRSYTTQLTMNIPFQSIHFIMYEYMQDVTNRKRKYDPSAHMLSGAVAGAVAAAVTNPLDVCKTLLNTQESGLAKPAGRQFITGLYSAMTIVYNCCGVRGYFQGMKPRILFQMPSTAIAWSVYEFFKFVLTQDPPSSEYLPTGKKEDSGESAHHAATVSVMSVPSSTHPMSVIVPTAS